MFLVMIFSNSAVLQAQLHPQLMTVLSRPETAVVTASPGTANAHQGRHTEILLLGGERQAWCKAEATRSAALLPVHSLSAFTGQDESITKD